jgi:hypothetical protein
MLEILDQTTRKCSPIGGLLQVDGWGVTMKVTVAGRRFHLRVIAGLTLLILATETYASSPSLLATAQIAPAAPNTPPKLEPFPTPPPHMIVMRSDQGDKRMLQRDGWTRREATANGQFSIHMTGPGGYSYSVTLAEDGAPRSMLLGRADAEAVQATRTGGTDMVLGERCEIWASNPPGEDRVFGGSVLTCIATDGIVLWNGSGSPGVAAPVIHSRAVALERRTPAWAEFSFPRQALNWSYWASRFPLPPDTARLAYEVRFGDNIIRVRGDTRFESRPNWLSIRNLNMRLRYTAPDGRPVSFSISTAPEKPYPHPLTGGSEPMDRTPMRITGETCNWHRVDLGVRWGIVGVCVTDDGIQLAEMTDFNDDVDREDKLEVATYFRRGAPDETLMSPPENVFEPWIAALPN